MPGLAIITGLVGEAMIAQRAVARAGGGERTAVRIAGPGRAGEAARRAVAEGAGALLSFGLAGALDPALAPGDLVLAAAIVDQSGRSFAVDAAWRDRLAARAGAIRNLHTVTIAGCDRVLPDAGSKAALLAATGAAAVDMESHAVAAAAAAAGLPVLALRAVADPAWRSISPSALRALMPDGRTRALPVLLGLLARPGDVGNVIGLARDNRAANAALRRVAALCAPTFGLV